MKAERQSNIELARIFAIVGVFILHYNNPIMGRGIAYAKGINLYILYFLESLSICGVDLFMLISGYFMCKTQKVSIWKPIKLLVQVVLFSFGVYLLRGLISGNGLSLKGVIASLVPANYFVILYSVTYLLAPYLNIIVNKLSEQQFRKFIVLLLILFSIWPTAVDVLSELIGHYYNGLSTVGVYGSQWGYSIVNFTLMYLVGAFLRREKGILDQVRTWKVAVSLFACVVVMIIWSRINDYIGYLTEKTAWEYCNPLVILSAVFIFLLFARLHLGVNRIINKISEGVFSIYLLHSIFLEKIGIEIAVQKNPVILLIHIFVSASLVCCICLFVHQLYSFISKPIFKKLEERVKVPQINVGE